MSLKQTNYVLIVPEPQKYALQHNPHYDLYLPKKEYYELYSLGFKS